MNNRFKKYIVFWLSQSVSRLGSAMTGFALVLWAYEREKSALAVSLMTFCDYVPYIIVSLFAGAFVDRHSKKGIMLTADSLAAVCSVVVLVLSGMNCLQIWHIYLVNAVLGFMNAFQGPASSVAVGKMVPKELLANVSGMNSFAENLVTVFAPMLAAVLFSIGGLPLILAVDLISFLAAFLVLLLWIKLPENFENIESCKESGIFSGCRDGFVFLREHKGIFMIVFTMSLLNFFSRLTYENILSPMILARSGGDSVSLGIVNAVMGAGGIVGGLLVSAGMFSKNHVRMIYVSAGISFLFGDLLMGMGRNVFVWSVAAAAASLPIPFICAGQNVILYRDVPEEMQGRVFAVRNAIQFGTIPPGILAGGFLADYVLEPFMQMENGATYLLKWLVGEGPGSGMAVMFLCTGICGSLFSFLAYRNREIRKLK